MTKYELHGFAVKLSENLRQGLIGTIFQEDGGLKGYIQIEKGEKHPISEIELNGGSLSFIANNVSYFLRKTNVFWTGNFQEPDSKEVGYVTFIIDTFKQGGVS